MSRKRDQLGIAKDFVAYVMGCAPDNFPYEDLLPPESKMTLEKSYAKLKGHLGKPVEFYGDTDAFGRCITKVEEAYEFYRKCDRPSGLQRIQEAYHLLRSL